MTVPSRVALVDHPVRAGWALGRGVGRLAPVRGVGHLVRWPVRTQLGSRRNALRACTDLADRRRQQEEVEAFLAARRPRTRPAGEAPTPAVRG